jgi:3-hydroxyacyl-CoA dehydrogenase
MRNGEAYFFTNTSSIPIYELDKLAGLNGKIIGFHFYNPPPVQKLVELIIPENCDPELVQLAEELGKRLNKQVIYSNDVAGFIGNGFFMQEIVYACDMASKFGAVHTDAEGIYLVDVVTKDFLLRPMGIFQLMDYVGIDVCSRVLKIMQKYMPSKIVHHELIDQMMLAGKLGGQNPFGLQNPGFFEYEGTAPKAVYSLSEKCYIPLERITKAMHEHLGESPSLTWKKLQNDASKDEKIKNYFKNLKEEKTLGSELGIQFLQHSKEIAAQLVTDGVAKNIKDIDSVLQNGFYHLYGVGVIENETI